MLVGAAQFDVSFAEKAINLEKCVHFINMAGSNNVKLLVFPECALTGYMFDSLDEALRVAETVPGESTAALAEACHRNNVFTAVGLLEKDGGNLFNTAVLISPQGIVGKYRKTHRITLGVDRFIQGGQDIPIFEVAGVKVGLLICYDQRFPEAARLLGLQGVQIILALSNLPVGAEAYAGFLNRARACENRTFLLSANRVGSERGADFLGCSQIIHVSGKILAEASRDQEEMLTAEIDPADALVKHVVNAPGEYEFDIFKDRRPGLYGNLIKGSL